MPQPTSGQVHVDAFLTNVSVAYMQNRTNFIAGMIFPTVRVDKRSNKYPTYTKADWFRDEAKLRESGAESHGSGFTLSSDTYFCDTYALHKDVGYDERDNADPGINLDQSATEFVTQRLLLRKEIQWVTEFFTTSVWGTDKTPANLWSSYTTSDPIGDIETGKTTVLNNTGMEVNTMAMGYQVWEKVKHHPDIVDRFKYTSSQSVSTEMFGALLEIPRVYVAKAIKNTKQEGVTATYSFTHGKHALLAHVAASPGLLTPSAGYTFDWTGRQNGLGTDITINNISMPHLKADRIEGEVAFDYKVVGSDLGYFFNGAVS